MTQAAAKVARRISGRCVARTPYRLRGKTGPGFVGVRGRGSLRRPTGPRPSWQEQFLRDLHRYPAAWSLRVGCGCLARCPGWLWGRYVDLQRMGRFTLPTGGRLVAGRVGSRPSRKPAFAPGGVFSPRILGWCRYTVSAARFPCRAGTIPISWGWRWGRPCPLRSPTASQRASPFFAPVRGVWSAKL